MTASGRYHETELASHGGRRPAEQCVCARFFEDCISRAGHDEIKNTEDEVRWLRKLTPAARAFWNGVQGNEIGRDLEDIFVQLPIEARVSIRDLPHLVNIIDHLVRMPPQFRTFYDADNRPIHAPVGTPLFVLLDPLSATPAGHTLFQSQKFNDVLKKLIDAWGQFLKTAESTSSLHDGEFGWFSLTALESLEEHRGEFNSTYICPNPRVPSRGYTSWDAFFTRRFKPGMRPIPDPHDNSLIHSACESTVYRKIENIRVEETFWLKGSEYTLQNMLGEDDTTSEQFIGGTFYQAILHPQDYHRWHSPVNGKVVRIIKIPGTHYTALPEGGTQKVPNDSDDQQAGDQPLTPIKMRATRVLIYIRAHDENIGLMCFVAIGLGEVSSCSATVEEGEEVYAGQELGTFHFGGSSQALIFRRGTRIRWIDCPDGKHVRVNSVIGRALSS